MNDDRAKTRTFPLGTVLSVTTERLVSPDHIDGVYKILNFMTGDKLWTHQLPRAGRECRPHLLRQHPQLDGPDMDAAVAELDRSLEGVEDHDECNEVVRRWVAGMERRFGKAMDVSPIPTGDYEGKNPVDELIDRMGSESRVIVVDAKATQEEGS